MSRSTVNSRTRAPGSSGGGTASGARGTPTRRPQAGQRPSSEASASQRVQMNKAFLEKNGRVEPRQPDPARAMDQTGSLMISCDERRSERRRVERSVRRDERRELLLCELFFSFQRV